MNNKLKAEILEYAEIHAKIELWGSKKTEEKSVFINLHYPIQGKKEYFIKCFNLGSIFEAKVKISPTWFEEITEEIIRKLEEEKKEKAEPEWECKKIIYQNCPEMLCGNNPCSCQEANNA